MDDGWVHYRQDPEDPEAILQDFSGVVRWETRKKQEAARFTGTFKGFTKVTREDSLREFRDPEDLGVFFHSTCAPKVKLQETLQHEISKLLADAIVAGYGKTLERWAGVPPASGEIAPPRFHAHVATVQGRRIFTMTRDDWDGFSTHEGKLVEVDLERTPAGGLEQSASVIACLAAQSAIHTTKIEVWRFSEEDRPGPHNLQNYVVLEGLTRRINLPRFAERASAQDTPDLRKYLRNHVFLVKERPDEGRREPKARALERIVFMAT